MDEINYFPLFVIFLIAWLVPLLRSWLEISIIPAVIAEIIMGVVIGPYGFDLIEETSYMRFLAETGFIFLIFLAGLEINVNKILSSFPGRSLRFSDFYKNSLLVALFIYFGSLFLSLPFAWFMGMFMEVDIIFYTMLLPTVALSITVPILKADGQMGRKFGQIMLMEGAIATVMSIILISVYSGVIKNGFRVELLLFSVIFLVFMVIYFVGQKLIKVRTFQKILYTLEHAASQIRVRGTVALVLFFVIVAHLINTELAMGAFFAGILLSLFINKDRSSLLFKLDGMSYGFFIPIFFIMVGVKLDISALSQFEESIPFILLLLFGFFFIQIIPSMIMTRVFGAKKALAGGILLSARMGLAIAAAQIGLSLGVINTADNAGIVAAAILTSLLAPLVYKLFNSDGEPYYNVYLFGGSRSSLLLAERFKMHDIPCLTIIENIELTAEFDRKDIKYRVVDNLDEDTLRSINLKTGDLVVILTGSKSLNKTLTEFTAEKLNHHKMITVGYTETPKKSETDIKYIDKEEMLASHVEDMIMRPDAITSLSQSFDLYRVEEIHITNKKVHRKLVKEIPFPPSGSLIIQRRGSEIFIPHGNTHLLMGDVITVIGNREALAEFRSLLE